jgi:hypothetical protein
MRRAAGPRSWWTAGPTAKKLFPRLLLALDYRVVRGAEAHFQSHDYLRHNSRRLEHLASLRIPVSGSRVLEVGAGIGDHSHYFLDRGCTLTVTEARPENLAALRARYPRVDVQALDLEHPRELPGAPYEIVYCYGLLYHLGADAARGRSCWRPVSHLATKQNPTWSGRTLATRRRPSPGGAAGQPVGGFSNASRVSSPVSTCREHSQITRSFRSTGGAQSSTGHG